MTEFDTKLTDVIQRAPDVKSFRFAQAEGAGFRPGQYFLLTINVGGKEETKPFSFSNSPTEKGYIEFTKRITGSDFSRTLASFEPGASARIKMPYGQFTFEGEHDKIAMLSGGIGITPFRSICKNATDKKLASDIVMLYGSNDESEIVFRDDFDAMQADNPKLRVVYTVTSPEAINKGSSCGRTGLIDHCMVSEEIPDYKDRIFYVSGPPGMVMCLCGILGGELGLPEEQIRTEKFAGY